MNCPACQHADSKVLETRTGGHDAIRRRRECRECGHRFTTMERIELRLPLVVKKDGTREPFDREKLRAGIALACRKRPVSAAAVEQVVRTVLDRLVGGASEVSTEDVGQVVLDALQPLDLVAYVRFASVYKEVQGAKDFVDLLSPWLDDPAEQGDASA